MATPPTRVSHNTPSSGNFSSSGTSKVTTSFDVATGDLVVVMASAEQHGTSSGVTPSLSGGSVTWTAYGDEGSGTAISGAWSWVGEVTSGATGVTCTLARPMNTSNNYWGFTATVFRDHGGVGVVFEGGNSTGSGAPSVAATCSANSLVLCQINDWNAVNGSSRTWRTINGSAETETGYYYNASRHTVYGAYRADTGSAGSITQGMTAPSTQRWVMVGFEILGTTGGGGTTHALSSTGTGASTGTLAVQLGLAAAATGTGSSTGSVNLLLAPGAMSATGTGTTTGSVNLNLAPGALSATGTGTTGGSAALSLVMPLGATGTGQTAGSAAVTIPPRTHSLAATGSGSSTGSLAVDLQLSCSSTGTGQTAGSLAVTETLALSSTGTGTSTGSLNVTVAGSFTTYALSSTGTGTTGGSAALVSTLDVSSTGTGTSAGSVGLTATLQLAASGSGTTAGSLSLGVVQSLSATGTGQTSGSVDVVALGTTFDLSATGTGTSSGSLLVTIGHGVISTGESQSAGSMVLNVAPGQLRAIGSVGATSGSLAVTVNLQLAATGESTTSGSLEMRVSTLWLTATGHSYPSGSLELSEPTFSFSMPTHEEPMRVSPDRRNAPLSYYRLTYAPSLVKVNGTWTAMRTPPPELLEGLTAGVDYFIGGFEYEIDQRTARDLALAGYTANPI